MPSLVLTAFSDEVFLVGMNFGFGTKLIFFQGGDVFDNGGDSKFNNCTSGEYSEYSKLI